MRIAMITSDSREVIRRYSDPEPSFGTAPEALMQGLAGIPECETHVVCCVQRPVRSPAKLADNIYYHSVVVPKTGWMRGAYMGCVRAVRKKLRQIQPALAHGQGTERDCALAAVYSGFPNVVTIHGNMRLIAKVNHARPFSFQWLAARLEAFTLPRANGIVCITGYTQRAVAPLARATWIVPNAVDGSFFIIEPRPAFPREIVCVANISLRKNQTRLIQALQPLAAAEKFELVFYGAADRKDPYVHEFFHLLEKSPWCRFAGFADRAGLRAALARASLLVLPSLEDNCPMSILEAMAAGVPVAAADVGGVPDLITHGTDGLLFDPVKEDSMRAAIAELLVNDQKRAELGARGKEKALQCFHPKKIAEKHLAIYRQVIASAKTSPAAQDSGGAAD
jgi:glycosyltransferase involved in cell wall biosynthesis